VGLSQPESQVCDQQHRSGALEKSHLRQASKHAYHETNIYKKKYKE